MHQKKTLHVVASASLLITFVAFANPAHGSDALLYQSAFKKEYLKKVQAARSAHRVNDIRYIHDAYVLARIYLSEQNYKEAEKLAREILSIMNEQPPEEIIELELASAKVLLAESLCGLKQLDEAIPLLIDSIEVQERLEPKQDSIMYNSMLQLAEIYREKGDLAQSEKCYRTILKNIYRRHDQIEWRRSFYQEAQLRLAGVICNDESKKAEAKAFVDQYFASLMRRVDKTSGFNLIALARVYSMVNEPRKQELCCKRAMSILEAAKLKSENDIKHYTEASTLLVSLFRDQHRDNELLLTVERVLAKRKEAGAAGQFIEFTLLVEAGMAATHLKLFGKAKQLLTSAKKLAEKDHDAENVKACDRLLSDILSGEHTAAPPVKIKSDGKSSARRR